MISTGTPISMMIENVDQRSKDYGEIAQAVPAGPRRLHLRDEIRPARPSRRRPLLGARNGGARGGRRAWRARSCRAWWCAARWSRWARNRSTAPTGTGISSATPKIRSSRPIRNSVAGLCRLSRRHPQGGVFGGRGYRNRRRGRARRASARRSTPSSTRISRRA